MVPVCGLTLRAPDRDRPARSPQRHGTRLAPIPITQAALIPEERRTNNDTDDLRCDSALIQTSAPLVNGSEEALQAAVVTAVEKAMIGARAMGFAWVALRGAPLKQGFQAAKSE
jgi:hypothetical protein